MAPRLREVQTHARTQKYEQAICSYRRLRRYRVGMPSKTRKIKNMLLTAYHKECLAIVREDERWEPCDADACSVCGGLAYHVSPDGKSTCPWCWQWANDTGAEKKPALPVDPTTPLRGERLPCDRCNQSDDPDLEWRECGKKKKYLAIGAFCRNCSAWIKWVDRDRYAPFAPPVGQSRFGKQNKLFETENPKTNKFFDTSLGSRKAKRKPPPLKEAPKKDVPKVAPVMVDCATACVRCDKESDAACKWCGRRTCWSCRGWHVVWAKEEDKKKLKLGSWCGYECAEATGAKKPLMDADAIRKFYEQHEEPSLF